MLGGEWDFMGANSEDGTVIQGEMMVAWTRGGSSEDDGFQIQVLKPPVEYGDGRCRIRSPR